MPRVSHAGYLFFALFAAVCVDTGCRPLCGNEILDETKSPNGKLKAVVFQRDCGATTGFSFHVSVTASDEKLSSESGNVFAGDDNHGAVVAMYIRTKWESDRSLVIEYPTNTRIISKHDQMRGVSVSYQTRP
jgi:hypothetical protein